MSSISKKLLVLVLMLAASAACGSFWSHSIGLSFEDYMHRRAVIQYQFLAGTFLFCLFLGCTAVSREDDAVWVKRSSSLIGFACMAVLSAMLGFGSYMPHVDWSIKPSGKTEVLYHGWVVNYPAECRQLENPNRQKI